MVEISAIAGALSALKAANDIAQAMMGLRDAAAFQSKLIEFQTKIIEANNSAFAAQDEHSQLLQSIKALEQEVESLKKVSTERARYQLKDYGSGTFAYELKAELANGEPIHRACPTCFNKGTLSILQFSHRADNGQDWFECWSCNSRKPFGTGRRVAIDYGGVDATY